MAAGTAPGDEHPWLEPRGAPSSPGFPGLQPWVLIPQSCSHARGSGDQPQKARWGTWGSPWEDGRQLSRS